MKKSDLKIKTDSGNDMKNVTLDYFFSFLRNFGVSQAIWVLFMVYRGQNLMEVGIAEGVFTPQPVTVTAACLVGALAEALVGPLAPGDKLADDEQEILLDGILQFCMRAIGTQLKEET